MIEFALLCFTSFFTLVNPLGTVPTFLTFTDSMNRRVRNRTALQASITLFLGITVFAYLGVYIFNFFGISIDALRVVGGLLLLDMGRDLLHGEPPKMKEAAEVNQSSIGIVPLGFPVLCGAGAITTAMVRKSQAVTFELEMIFIGVVVLISIITFIILRGSGFLTRNIGENGQAIVNRIMGLLIMIIAIEFMFAGIKPYLIDILKQAIG